eukprot:4776220-Amphidinium_carterae.1
MATHVSNIHVGVFVQIDFAGCAGGSKLVFSEVEAAVWVELVEDAWVAVTWAGTPWEAWVAAAWTAKAGVNQLTCPWGLVWAVGGMAGMAAWLVEWEACVARVATQVALGRAWEGVAKVQVPHPVVMQGSRTRRRKLRSTSCQVLVLQSENTLLAKHSLGHAPMQRNTAARLCLAFY